MRLRSCARSSTSWRQAAPRLENRPQSAVPSGADGDVETQDEDGAESQAVLQRQPSRNRDVSPEPDILERNLDAARRLLARLGKPWSDPRRGRAGSVHTWGGSHLWEDVDADDVIGFLDAYRSHPEAHKVNSNLLAEFIRSLVRENELTSWTVALIGTSRSDRRHHAFHDGLAVRKLERGAHGRHPDRYSVRRIMSPRDEAIDLDESAWKAALTEARKAFHADSARNQSASEPREPNGPAIRKVRPRERGVLFLYLLDPALAGSDSGLAKDGPPVVGFALSFPVSNTGVRVDYKVNNILWEQEFGASE